MGTTADKLAYLAGTKSAIREAIIDKGVNVPEGTTFRQYASKIADIQDVGSLPTQGAKTVTPTTTEQVAVASGRYTTGDVKVAGDANLVAENIAEGVSIFGVTGTHSGGGGDLCYSETDRITWWSNVYNTNNLAFIVMEYDGTNPSLGTEKRKLVFGFGTGPFYNYSGYCEPISNFRFEFHWGSYDSLYIMINDYDENIGEIISSHTQEIIGVNGFHLKYYLPA